MSQKTSHKIYFVIFGWLILFTIVELVAAGASAMPRSWVVGILLGTALGKAILIALYFMHLKFEGPLVWLLPGIPLFFIIFFVLGLVPDIAWHLTGNFR